MKSLGDWEVDGLVYINNEWGWEISGLGFLKDEWDSLMDH